jgi:hypothetical protein
MTTKAASRTKTAVKPSILLADPSQPSQPTEPATPIIAMATVLSNGIHPDDVTACNKLADQLKAHRKADKEICRDLGKLWLKMKASYSGEGSAVNWIVGQFHFAQRTVYLYMELADKWTAAEADWKERHPELPVALATVNEFMGSLERKWSPLEDKTPTTPTVKPSVKPTTNPTPPVTPTEAKETTAPNGATTTTTAPPEDVTAFRPLTSFEQVFTPTPVQIDEGFAGLLMIHEGIDKLTETGSEKIMHALAHIAQAADAIHQELLRLKPEARPAKPSTNPNRKEHIVICPKPQN